MKKKIICFLFSFIIFLAIYLSPITLTFSTILYDASGMSPLPIELKFYYKRYLDAKVYDGTITLSNQQLSLSGVEPSEIAHLYYWVKFHYMIDNEYKPEDTINLYFETPEGYDGYLFINSRFHHIHLIIHDPIHDPLVEHEIRYYGKIEDLDLVKN